MDNKLFGKVVQRVKAVAGIETLLVLPMAALHFAVVAGRIRTYSLVANAKIAAVASNSVGKSLWLLEKRLVNSKPLSVWMHSTWMPRRAYHLTNFFRKSAEE